MISPAVERPKELAAAPDCAVALHAVSDMTRSDSSELMRRRFAENLTKLFPIASISFLAPSSDQRLNTLLRCEVIRRDGQTSCYWDNQPRRGNKPGGALAAAMQSLKPHIGSGEDRIDYFPICVDRKLLEMVEIRRSPVIRCNTESLAHVLSIYCNFVRILHMQERDALTGVLNRGAFDSQISAIAQSLRQSQDLRADPARWWLIMLDVDHFKQVNDQFGHLIGDEVLLLAARLMVKTVRAVDRVYRYGGEEFAILVSPCRRADARTLAERVRQCLAQAHFPQVEHITISAGMAPIDSFDHVANIVGRADKALYQAKRGGRNRVCEYAEQAAVSFGPGLQTPGALELFN